MRGMYKHPVKFVKIEYTQDESGSMVKEDSETINTKCRILHNDKNRENQNNEITYLCNKTIQINDYVNITGYDEFELCHKRYRILDIETNEDWQYKTVIAEEIND